MMLNLFIAIGLLIYWFATIRPFTILTFVTSLIFEFLVLIVVPEVTEPRLIGIVLLAERQTKID